MAKRGYFSKGRRASKSSGRSTGYAARGSGRSTKRRSSGRGTGGGRTRAVAPQTIRIVFAQEPGGAALANPALPIPPSITTDKTRKAKL